MKKEFLERLFNRKHSRAMQLEKMEAQNLFDSDAGCASHRRDIEHLKGEIAMLDSIIDHYLESH